MERTPRRAETRTNVVFVPAKCSSNALRWGPSPTMASLVVAGGEQDVADFLDLFLRGQPADIESKRLSGSAAGQSLPHLGVPMLRAEQIQIDAALPQADVLELARRQFLQHRIGRAQFISAWLCSSRNTTTRPA